MLSATVACVPRSQRRDAPRSCLGSCPLAPLPYERDTELGGELDVARPGGGLGSEAGDRLAFDKALYDGADHAGPQLRPFDSEARYWSSAWPIELFSASADSESLGIQSPRVRPYPG